VRVWEACVACVYTHVESMACGGVGCVCVEGAECVCVWRRICVESVACVEAHGL
jgi:hypothetical protein